MVLSKRERIIAIASVAALVVLVLDHYALTPLLDANNLVTSKLVTARDRRDQDTALLTKRDAMARKWDAMVAGGMKSDPAQAEGEVLHAVEGWATAAGLSLSSMTPERIAQGGDLAEITVQVSGTGSMAAVSNFLWRVEGSPMPLRIRDMTVTPRREGADDLALSMHVSTLYLGTPPAKAPAPATPAKPAEEES